MFLREFFYSILPPNTFMYKSFKLKKNVQLFLSGVHIQGEAHKVLQSDSIETIDHILECFWQKFQFSRKSPRHSTTLFFYRWRRWSYVKVLLMWVHRNAKMNNFQQYFDMLMVLGECRKHNRNAQDSYAAHYPDRQQKSHMTFKRLADHFCRFGTVKQTQVKRRKNVNENNAATILAFAAVNPHASSRQMEKYGKDFLKRVNFCNWIRRKLRTDVSIFSPVVFSDEANFANAGNVNRYNIYI